MVWSDFVVCFAIVVLKLELAVEILMCLSSLGEGNSSRIYGTKKKKDSDYIAIKNKNYWTCNHYCNSLIEQLAYHFNIITIPPLPKAFPNHFSTQWSLLRTHKAY